MHRCESNTERGLWLHEELVLFALDDESGRWHSCGYVDYALSGAILSELALAGCIEMTEDKAPQVVFRRLATFDDELLDEALKKIVDAPKPKSAVDWIGVLARLPDMRLRIARGLCRRGILEEIESRHLFVFTSRRFPTLDPTLEYDAVDRSRAAIFSDVARIDPRTAMLIALADVVQLLPLRFSADALRKRKERLEWIREHSGLQLAARKAIAAIQAASAAAMAAIMAATIVSS